jgi:hypothetical protein
MSSSPIMFTAPSSGADVDKPLVVIVDGVHTDEHTHMPMYSESSLFLEILRIEKKI